VAIRVKTAPVRKQGRRMSRGHREQYSAGGSGRGVAAARTAPAKAGQARVAVLLKPRSSGVGAGAPQSAENTPV
jgi:hypothetical protein